MGICFGQMSDPNSSDLQQPKVLKHLHVACKVGKKMRTATPSCNPIQSVQDPEHEEIQRINNPGASNM